MPISEDVSLPDELRAAIRTHLVEWARLALTPLGQQPARHHLLIVAELEAVARGGSGSV
jgi:hypothetical protein